MKSTKINPDFKLTCNHINENTARLISHLANFYESLHNKYVYICGYKLKENPEKT